MFQKYQVNLVLSGHEHVYERIKPQNGIFYFVVGNSGELRAGGLQPSANIVKGVDTDRTFLAIEISGDQLFFQTISRAGVTVDTGLLLQQKAVAGSQD
jgi:hypothetical protein